ncbi:LETM1 domain-containing protein 1 isoform X2 [Coregonus clupeaformis]|uniref:LETM1 domain-containing protein 1 isoform X2 n=1 Tax=Coregonus clupeaformis TaxID=59861 RepID=UPI001BE0AC93|nr:LETM1 domain-containing protein 1 isoform X2 [Coregonus clupeaformis]
MALSCVAVCRGLSVALYGIRINGVTVIYSSFTATSGARLPLYRHYSSPKSRLGIGLQVVSRLQEANAKYELFLQRCFPRFYVLHHTFTRGIQLLFQDAKEVKVIKTRMLTNSVEVQDLPYRDMEKLRQLLIRHFWTPQQQNEFQGVNHSHRAQHHWAVLKGLESAGSHVKDGCLKISLLDLCNKVQSGVHPNISDIQAIRGLFSGPPLSIKRINADQMRQLCPLFFLTPHLPTPMIGTRLNSHAIELLQLDRALSRHGLHQLDDSELRQACYVRGLDSGSLSVNQCQEWLSQWLQFSSRLKESEVSLLVHSMVLLSANYPKPSRY